MHAKYCGNEHPAIIQWKPGQSHSWKAMCELKNNLEGNMWRKIRKGDTRFWYDNWTSQGPLYSNMGDNIILQNIRIKDVFKDGQWDWSCLNPHPPEHIKDMISAVTMNILSEAKDMPYWTCSKDEKFSISTAWSMLRQRRQISQFDTKLWQNNILIRCHLLFGEQYTTGYLLMIKF